MACKRTLGFSRPGLPLIQRAWCAPEMPYRGFLPHPGGRSPGFCSALVALLGAPRQAGHLSPGIRRSMETAGMLLPMRGRVLPLLLFGAVLAATAVCARPVPAPLP